MIFKTNYEGISEYDSPLLLVATSCNSTTKGEETFFKLQIKFRTFYITSLKAPRIFKENGTHLF